MEDDDKGVRAFGPQRQILLEAIVKNEHFFDEEEEEYQEDSEQYQEEGFNFHGRRTAQEDGDEESLSPSSSQVKVELGEDEEGDRSAGVKTEPAEEFDSFMEDIFTRTSGGPVEADAGDSDDDEQELEEEGECDPSIIKCEPDNVMGGWMDKFYDETEEQPCSSASVNQSGSQKRSKPQKRKRKEKTGAKSAKSQKLLEPSTNTDPSGSNNDSKHEELLQIASNLEDGAKVCPFCQKEFKFPSHLKMHLRIHTQETPFKCSYCDKRFAQQATLDRHHKTHPEFSQVNKQEEKERLRKLRLTCPTCQKTFARKQQLESHSRTHTGEKPYRCLDCGKAYKQVSHLNVHMRVHTGEKSYQCKDCDKSFSEARILRIHMRGHTGEKPYKCEDCDMSFRQLGHLRSHVRTHTGQKPYECKQCPMKFAASASLYLHMRSHTGEKPHKCLNCSKAFRQASHLRYHINSKICTDDPPPRKERATGMKYKKNKGSTANLRKTSANTNLFKCQACKKTFQQRWLLTMHTQSHFGCKPHECTICKKRFAQSFNLSVHLKTHKGDVQTSAQHRTLPTPENSPQKLCPTFGKKFARKAGPPKASSGRSS